MVDVDNEKDIGNRAHLLDAAQASLELFLLAGEAQYFFLCKSLETTVFCHFLQRHQTLHRLANRFVVREHATQPALTDKRHFATHRVSANRFTSGTLGAYKQDGAAIGDSRLNERACFARQWKALFEVDNVDFVTFAKDERCHLGVPVTGLMTKVHASL